MTHAYLRRTASLLLFGSLVTVLQTGPAVLIGCWGLCAGLLALYKPMRWFVLTATCFGAGFFVYLHVNSHWIAGLQPMQLRILISRGSLLLVILPLVLLTLARKLPFTRYGGRPQWNEPVGVPWIWAGVARTNVSVFLQIAITVSGMAFLPLMLRSGWVSIQEAIGFAVLFAITNALLEELIWRGVLLSRFVEQVGERWAVVLTSLGFGLQHYSLGFSWDLCIAFAVGGFYFGAMTVQSKSIVPAVVWHMSINIWMVLGGIIG